MPEQSTFGHLVLFEEQSPAAIPHDIFPGVIGGFASAVSASIQVPFELPLLNSLGAIAAASQRKFRVLVREGYSEPLNIFGVAILPPGERKSAAKDACRAPLLEWEREQQRQTSESLKYAHAQRQVQEELIRVAIAKAKRCQDSSEQGALIRQVATLREEMESLPVAPRLLADDATPEGLAALMAQHDQRIAMIEAEGGFLDILAGRYSHGVPNLDAVLKSWSGEAVRIDRRHAEAILIEEPTLTLVLSAQPDVLAGLCHVTLHDAPQHHPLSGQTVECAVCLAKLLTEHARAAFSLMGADDSIECARAILQWLRQDRLATFTGRSALEKVKGRWPKMALVNQGLAILEERGFILPRDHVPSGRGRPSRVFLVNPLIHPDSAPEAGHAS